MVFLYHFQLVLLLFWVFRLPLCMEIQASRIAGESKFLRSCLKQEREALLMFKKGLSDPSNRLSSWVEEEKDCCAWEGVECNNQTGHVVTLDLHGPNLADTDDDDTRLGGVLSHSLVGLQRLSYLDLSSNNFQFISIPKFFGSFPKLRHLNLSSSGFEGRIPNQLGNLSNLEYLDLNTADSPTLDVDNLDWVSRLSSLRHLDLSGTDLSGSSVDWFHKIINHLPFLADLHLAFCNLGENFTSINSVPVNNISSSSSSSLELLDLSHNSLLCLSIMVLSNMTSLVHLDLSWNQLNCSISQDFRKMGSLTHLDLSSNNFNGLIPHFVGEMTSLVYLDLSANLLEGSLPNSLSNITSLTLLHIVSNKLEGGISTELGKLCNLKSLQLPQNNLTGVVSDGFWSGCIKNSLEILDLSTNKLTGHLSHDLGTFLSMKEFRLKGNRMNGTLPQSMGHLSQLVELDISSNTFNGSISETHLQNLSKLQQLDISSNSFILNLSFGWIPPFQLETVRMRSCRLGPAFPAWLQSQNRLGQLDISNSSIHDRIPNWFWNISSNMIFMDLSSNHIYGKLPDLSSVFIGETSTEFTVTIDLSSNNLSGSLPPVSNAGRLNLARNSFSGFMSDLLCKSLNLDSSLQHLDLSQNDLSGNVPDCLMYCTELITINLASNRLSGEIPNSIGHLQLLESLHLNDNNFSGKLPSSLKNCTSLKAIDVGENKLTGNIPSSIWESLQDLLILRLHSNQLDGNIPSQLCQLAELHILDLAENNIMGSIPRCFSNFTAMASINGSKERGIFYDFVYKSDGPYEEKTMVGWKGKKSEFQKILRLVMAIDLSSNNLSGKIPRDLMHIFGLHALNLSRNLLTGKIPSNIEHMENLEILDLSCNQLSGVIPVGLATLTSLNALNLSHNNLYGEIPKGSQMQTFEPSSFTGNSKLCGPPLLVSCTKSPPSKQVPPVRQDANGTNIPWFYIGLGMGYITGFWAVCLSLIFRSSWRTAFFLLVDQVEDWMYVVVVVKARKMWRKFGG